jgi:ferrous iron transport protein A
MMFRSSLLRCIAVLNAFVVSDGSARTGAGAGIPGVERSPIDVTMPLDRVEVGAAYAVHEIVDPPAGSDWPQRLEEIGFLPGERVVVMVRAMPGGDPLAVRVGHSTFALRRAEAACVLVRPWPASLE